jgi:hypothetical protein
LLYLIWGVALGLALAVWRQATLVRLLLRRNADLERMAAESADDADRLLELMQRQANRRVLADLGIEVASPAVPNHHLDN